MLALAFVLAFAPTLFYMPRFVRLVHEKKELLRRDMNKQGTPPVPSMGGIALVTGFMFSIATVILVSVLFSQNSIDYAVLLPSLLTLALIALLGLVDDIIVIPKRFTKPILTLYAAIPMMAIAGLGSLDTLLYVPFFGGVELGLLYYLLIIPLAIIFCSNAVNILSTYNGLEAGMGIIVALGILLASLLKGSYMGALVMVPLVAVLIVFLRYNKFPARLFLGNTGTLFIGGALAVGAILGNVERALVIMMIPYFIHFLLYSRNLFAWKPEMWSKPQADGTLKAPYEKPYGLMHWLVMNRKGMTEKKVVYYLIAAEILFVVIAVAMEAMHLKIVEIF